MRPPPRAQLEPPSLRQPSPVSSLQRAVRARCSFLPQAWSWSPLCPLSLLGHYCQVYLATHPVLKLGHATALNVSVFSWHHSDLAQTPAAGGPALFLSSRCKHRGPPGPRCIQALSSSPLPAPTRAHVILRHQGNGSKGNSPQH